jgi:[ribosomal protein S18]-alanine N-acetyltransferase
LGHQDRDCPAAGRLLRFAPAAGCPAGDDRTPRLSLIQSSTERAIVTATTPHGLGIHVRWMIRRDMPEVIAIEHEAFEFPWSEEDFTRCLRQRNCIGMVAELADSVVAFMIYELHRSRLHMLNFAVMRSHRRLGIGTQMMEKLVAKLTPDRRGRIALEVRETNLPAQLFFRSLGFRATSVLKDFYRDSTEDAYMMQYSLEAATLPVERRLAG